jgi:hypothetical protein
MARWSIALHCIARVTDHLQEPLVADGFEGYLHSKYFPHHLNILVGKDSQYFYAMDFSTLRRKGSMNSAQKRRRAHFDRICRPDPKGIERSMHRLSEELLHLFDNRRIPVVELYTDDHQAYPRALYRHRQIALLQAERLIIHHRVKGRKHPGRNNVLYGVNYMDRQFRKDLASYVRSTVNTARNVCNLLDRLCVYRLYHNFLKPFRENRPKDGLTHGGQAGLDMQWLSWPLSRRFIERPFASLLPLSPGEKGLWYRLYRTPLKVRPEYLPKHVWA